MRVQTNLLLTNLAADKNVNKMAKQTIFAFSMTIIEVFLLVWTGRKKYTIDKVVIDDTSDKILNDCLNHQEQLLFITPHLGNFELAVLYVTNKYKLCAQILYKPIKIKSINYLMQKGMSNEYITLCPVNSKKDLLTTIRHFKNGMTIGMLPDSIASKNNGVWVEFFGQQIYASSLAGSLSIVPNTKTLLVQCIRTASGYSLSVQKVEPVSDNPQQIVQQIYNQIELLVKENPTQYYWSYDRFRIPKYVR
jgi:KDO2-lipid IV(A) lauroyltransferase